MTLALAPMLTKKIPRYRAIADQLINDIVGKKFAVGQARGGCDFA